PGGWLRGCGAGFGDGPGEEFGDGPREEFGDGPGEQFDEHCGEGFHEHPGKCRGYHGGRRPMTARILDGRATAAAIKGELSRRVAALTRAGTVPGLGTVLVGDDPGSRAYVAGKHRDSEQVGIASIRRDLPADATQQQVEAAVDELNADPACTGYIVQLPLPRGLDPHRVLLRMDPAKDADGLHPVNLGRLVLGEPGPLPA